MESKELADGFRRDLAGEMRKNVEAIEADVLARIAGPEEKWPAEGGGHSEEARKAVRAVLEYGLRAIEGKRDRHPPPEAVAYARELAWQGVPTYVVLLACGRGEAAFKEHLRRAESSIKSRSRAGGADAVKALEDAFTPVRIAVAKEHAAEERRLKASPDARRLETVKQLLSGELIHPPDLGYDFSATHIGVVGSGPGVEGEIRRLAKMLGGQLLIVQASPDQFWAWIGLKQESSTARLKDILEATLDPAVCVAIGDSAADLDGWRQTHREAEAAFPVALHRPGSVMRYADVSVLASILGNPLLQQSLRTELLDPLAGEKDGGRQLLTTLRTYFALDRNGRATAAALGVHPQTITNHLQRVEQCLGRSSAACGIGLEAAVLFEDLTS